MQRHTPQAADLPTSGGKRRSAANPLRKPHYSVPGVKRIGILSGSPDLDFEAESETDDEGVEWVYAVSTTVVLSADAFRCPVCQLRLQGQEQLQEAGLPIDVEIRPATPEDIDGYYGESGGKTEEYWPGPDEDGPP